MTLTAIDYAGLFALFTAGTFVWMAYKFMTYE